MVAIENRFAVFIEVNVSSENSDTIILVLKYPLGAIVPDIIVFDETMFKSIFIFNNSDIISIFYSNGITLHERTEPHEGTVATYVCDTVTTAYKVAECISAQLLLSDAEYIPDNTSILSGNGTFPQSYEQALLALNNDGML